MTATVGDTSLLEAFTRVRALNALTPWAPIHVSRDVVREHQQTAPSAAHQYLLKKIDEGLLVIMPSRRTSVVVPKNCDLSPVDLKGVEWAKKNGGWLLADDQDVCICADHNDIDVLDVPGVLRALRDADLVDAGTLRKLAMAIDLDADREFSDDDAREFDIR